MLIFSKCLCVCECVCMCVSWQKTPILILDYPFGGSLIFPLPKIALQFFCYPIFIPYPFRQLSPCISFSFVLKGYYTPSMIDRRRRFQDRLTGVVSEGEIRTHCNAILRPTTGQNKYPAAEYGPMRG